MPSEWISHVKAFQHAHGCSYKDALKGASSTYTKKHQRGGNITKTAKTSGKQVITASGDRAVQAIEGSGVRRGRGINRLKKANRWETFADSTLHDMIDTGNKARKTYQKGQQGEMTAMGLKKHRRKRSHSPKEHMGGSALYPAGM